MSDAVRNGPRADDGDADARRGAGGDRARPAVVVEEYGDGRVALVRVERPAERNSLSAGTIEELDSAVSALTGRAGLRAVVFTGAGDVFAAGADIRELRRLAPESARVFARRGQELMRGIARAPQLTLAAVNGYCMGGGLDLALACDLRVASPAAVLAHPGARLGIITGWGGTQRLPRLVGRARALEMLLTARRVNGAEAFEMGLVNFLSDAPLELALELALTLPKPRRDEEV
jgi:enoyl-CoA hydratase